MDDRWCVPMLAGASLVSYPRPAGVQFLMCAGVLVIAFGAWRSGGLGLGDVLPLSIGAFVLGWLTPVMLVSMVGGLAWTKRTGRMRVAVEAGRKLTGGAAVPWIAVGVYAGLLIHLV